MIFLEMSRDEHHGGGTWGFTRCVWAPTEKNGGGTWPFWEKVRSIKAGDVIIHLRGKSPGAVFIGYSTASGDGFETARRPPNPDEWSFSAKYFRADLTAFTPFAVPLRLADVFRERKDQLERYFEKNKAAGSLKKNIFYVIQSGRLQCLNGAYLSEIDDELFEMLFGTIADISSRGVRGDLSNIDTRSEIKALRVRIGQSRFSESIRSLYRSKCCFPECVIGDGRFLVASHIARWSDNEELRGDLGNGLCLCLTHDKAFELGVFTLSETFRVFLNPKYNSDPSPVVQQIRQQVGKRIETAAIVPLEEALLEHWMRTDQTPTDR